jgi:hypothetical protein
LVEPKIKRLIRRAFAGGIGGSTDHGTLSGLLDDDHTNLLNEARHDALAADNPHSVTFTQAVTADGGTDISAAEAEILTDGSNADALHIHSPIDGADHGSLAGLGDVADHPDYLLRDGSRSLSANWSMTFPYNITGVGIFGGVSANLSASLTATTSVITSALDSVLGSPTAINVLTGLNMSTFNIINAGDVELDSLTADASTIAVNDSLVATIGDNTVLDDFYQLNLTSQASGMGVIQRAYGTLTVPQDKRFRSRGTAASPTAVLSGDIFGIFEWWGRHEFGEEKGAEFNCAAAENWQLVPSLARAAKVTIRTRNFADAYADRLIIDGDGHTDLNGNDLLNADNIGACIAVTTQDTVTNYNGTNVAVAWDQAAHINEGVVFTHSAVTNNSRISVDRDGIYRISCVLHFTSTVQRAAVYAEVRVGGSTVLSGRGASGYIRASTTTHDESSVHINILANLSASDYIEIITNQEAQAGTVNLVSNTSEINLELVRQL